MEREMRPLLRDYVRRLHARQTDIAELSFETTLTTRVTQKVFHTRAGYQTSLNGMCRRLMGDTGLWWMDKGKTRAAYSLRQNNATMELLNNKTNICIFNGQMGTSAAVLARQYSKLTASMTADRLT
jgi:integrase